MNGSDNSKPSKFDGGFYNAITVYRIVNFFKRKKNPFIPKVFEGLAHFLFSLVIPGFEKTAANFVVLNYIPDGVTVVGIPGEILNEK